MKRFKTVCLKIALVGLTGCAGNQSSIGPSGSGPATISVRASLANNSVLSINPTAQRAVVITLQEAPQVVEIVDGVFQTDLPLNSACGIFFVGENDEYLGYLSLADGLDVLPTTKIQDGLNEIDLGELISNGESFSPSNDLFSEQLPLSLIEQAALAQSDDYLASFIKNADANGDGVLDVLTENWYTLRVRYAIQGGVFERGQRTVTLNAPVAIDWARLRLHSYGTNRPATASFSGPSFRHHDYFPGMTFSDLYPMPAQEVVEIVDYAEYESYFTTGVPQGGNYKVFIGGETLALTVPDQSSADDRIVIPLPTITLKDDRSVEAIHWDYQLGDGQALETPSTILARGVEIKMWGPGSGCDGENGVSYRFETLSPDQRAHTLNCKVKWEDVTLVTMAYKDIFGNLYEVNFRNAETRGW